MNSDLTEYLEYLCSEKEEINELIVVSNEGLPIALASSIQTSDQTLVSGMCTALKCIARELLRETMDSNLKRMLVDCTDGVVLIHPLKKGILVVSCKSAAILNELDISSIQKYFSPQQDHLFVS